jgi:hypothetical protein
MRPWMKAGIGAGAAFSTVGIGFVAVSLFTDISRSTWVTFDSVKGVIGFAFCGLVGFLIARQTHQAGSGAAAGALGGAIAGVTVPVSMYVLAYGFIDSVRQYPFEYYDYLSSGASTVQAFLLSTKGHADVLSTSIGLVPVVALFAAALGGAVGFFGGLLGRGRSGPIPEATRPIKPLQPTSGEDKSSPIRRTASTARG